VLVAPGERKYEWNRWRLRRGVGAATTVVVVLSGFELAGCGTHDCVQAAQDRFTASIVGPTDGPPTDPVVIPTAVISTTGGAETQYINPPTIDARPIVHG
jgi:hypothetical protein